MFITPILLFVGLWWFFWKKKYYIRIDSVGNDKPAMEQIIKIELETTLRYAIRITESTPYLIEAGNYFNAKSVVKTINKNGGKASLTFHGAWSKPQEGPVAA